MTITNGRLYYTHSVRQGTGFPYNWTSEEIEVGKLHIPKFSYPEVFAAFHDPIVRKKRITNPDDKVELGETFCFGTWKISLKRGSTTISFDIGAYATPTNLDLPPNGHGSTVCGAKEFAETCKVWQCYPEGDFEPFWEVISPITVRSRQDTGGHKIVGRVTTREELARLADKAEEQATWSSDLPEFMEFVEDGITVGDIPKRNLPEIVADGFSKKWTIRGVHTMRGFRNIAMIGFVHVVEGREVIPVTGGSRTPFFMLHGEIENAGAFTSRSIIVNNDGSGYLPIKIVQNKPFVATKLDKRMQALTFSDQQMIKLAISDYIAHI